jgi:hypothetical protein
LKAATKSGQAGLRRRAVAVRLGGGGDRYGKQSAVLFSFRVLVIV